MVAWVFDKIATFVEPYTDNRLVPRIWAAIGSRRWRLSAFERTNHQWQKLLGSVSGEVVVENLDRIVLSGGVELLPIPGFSCAKYRAGTDGYVYSATKIALKRAINGEKWARLNCSLGRLGYPRTTLLSESGKQCGFHVHQLICLAFHGQPPDKASEVRHLDGTRTNNRPENLRWGTYQENWNDRKLHGRGIAGEKNPRSKISDEERGHIRWAFERGLCTQSFMAKVLGLRVAVIHAACHFGEPVTGSGE